MAVKHATKPAPQKQEIQVHPRFPDDIIERIDAHVTRMMASTPGIEFSRADAVVSLVVRGLAAAEKERMK